MRSLGERDPHRARFHFQPPSNWMNDPNGLIHWQGRYHLFYQYNPNGPFHGSIHWGHAATDDLVHWQDLPIALAPTPGGPDKDGCFSGCAVDADGVPTLVYTGIRPEVQCLAIGDDHLTTWTKPVTNPVIAAPPDGLEVEGFRDPFMWRDADRWRCIVGSGIKNVGGIIFLYESTNLTDWRYLHPFCNGQIEETGRMWECPNFLPLGNKHVLLVSPIPLGKVLYLVGIYENDRFTPERVGTVDDGGSYYAPQVMRDDRGRWLMWGWLREARGQDAQRLAGWSGVMSVPTILSLAADGSLALAPVPELRELRGSHDRIVERWLAPGDPNPIPSVAGRQLEIVVEAEPAGDGTFVVEVLRSPDGAEVTRIFYDARTRQLGIDRERSSLDPATTRDVRATAVRLTTAGTVKLQIFVDGSVVEVFANDHISLTSRVYPTRPDSQAVALVAQNDSIHLRSLDVWEMGSIWPDSPRAPLAMPPR